MARRASGDEAARRARSISSSLEYGSAATGRQKSAVWKRWRVTYAAAPRGVEAAPGAAPATLRAKTSGCMSLVAGRVVGGWVLVAEAGRLDAVHVVVGQL